MRMFKREKYPAQDEGINLNATNGGNLMQGRDVVNTEAAVAGNDVMMPYKSKPRGAARVLIAARTLFPGMPNDDAALDLLMDVFEEKMRPLSESVNSQNIPASLYEDEKRLKQIIPGFSVSKAFENEEFKRLVLGEGMDLFTAYEKLNPTFGGEKVGIIDEVGSTAYASTPGSSSSDITSLSDEEFKRYIKRIQEEELK